MLLRGWYAEDMAQSNFKIDVKFEPWLRRYSRKKVPQNNIAISYSLLLRTLSPETNMNILVFLLSVYLPI
jgi:hypothetical protein